MTGVEIDRTERELMNPVAFRFAVLNLLGERWRSSDEGEELTSMLSSHSWKDLLDQRSEEDIRLAWSEITPEEQANLIMAIKEEEEKTPEATGESLRKRVGGIC